MRVGVLELGSASTAGSMAQLLRLAQQFQEALDAVPVSGSSDAAELAGNELYRAMCAAVTATGSSISQLNRSGVEALQPIIIESVLAISIAAFLERLPWAAATPEMLCQPAGTPFAAVRNCINVLASLFRSAAAAAATDNGGTSLEAGILLRQVHTPFHPQGHCSDLSGDNQIDNALHPLLSFQSCESHNISSPSCYGSYI